MPDTLLQSDLRSLASVQNRASLGATTQKARQDWLELSLYSSPEELNSLEIRSEDSESIKSAQARSIRSSWTRSTGRSLPAASLDKVNLELAGDTRLS